MGSNGNANIFFREIMMCSQLEYDLDGSENGSENPSTSNFDEQKTYD